MDCILFRYREVVRKIFQGNRKLCTGFLQQCINPAKELQFTHTTFCSESHQSPFPGTVNIVETHKLLGYCVTLEIKQAFGATVIGAQHWYTGPCFFGEGREHNPGYCSPFGPFFVLHTTGTATISWQSTVLQLTFSSQLSTCTATQTCLGDCILSCPTCGSWSSSRSSSGSSQHQAPTGLLCAAHQCLKG